MAMFRSIATGFKNIGDTIGDATTSAFDNVTSTVKQLPSTLNIADKLFHEKIKAFKLPENQKRTKADEEAEAAAAKRAEEILSKLYQNYFLENFDAVKFELSQLDVDSTQESIDGKAEQLMGFVEVVRGRLLNYVYKNHDKLIAGITNVAQVEGDIQDALEYTQRSRAVLKASAEEVQRNMLVASQTRRKQSCMTLLEMCLKVQRAKDLQQLLKKAQESGQYGEAIMLCVECFRGVGSLSGLNVAGELHESIKRLYLETMQKLDNTLQGVCSDFDPNAYSKVLEGYMLNLDGKGENILATKVLACFKDSIRENSAKVVRSMLLTRAKLDMGNEMESSFGEMCRRLPVDLLRPTLFKMFEVLFDVLGSYQLMMRWHELSLQRDHLLKAPSGELPALGDGDNSAQAQQFEVMSQMEAATRAFITATHETMVNSKLEVWDAVHWRIKDLLDTIPFKGEDFLQVVEWCQKFLATGEAFIGKPSDLRDKVVEISAKFFELYHKNNQESLMMLLSNEHWSQIGTSDSTVGMLDLAIRQSPLYVPALGAPGAVTDFEEYLRSGNPFRRASSKKTSKKEQLSNQLLMRKASSAPSLDKLPSQDTGDTSPADSGNQQPSVVDPGSSDENVRRGETVSAAAESSGRPASTPSPPRMLTISSQQILKWMKSYGHLLKPMQPRSEAVFHGLCELFDTYLLTSFTLFSNISMEALVWQEDAVPLRLRSTMLRIFTADGSKYKAQVEELQSRPRPPPVAVAVQLHQPAAPLEPIASTFKTLGQDMGAGFRALGDTFKNPFEHMGIGRQHREAAAGHPPGRSSDGLRTNSSTSGHSGESHSPQQSPGSAGGRPWDALSGASVTTSGNLYGLKERVAAVDSLMLIAEELKAARPALQAILPPDRHRELDTYFSRTVEAVGDLRDTIFRGGVRMLLSNELSPEGGIAAQVAATNYAIREPASNYSTWSELLVRHYATFRDLLASASLPEEINMQMWEQAVACGGDAILEGLARSRRCTVEGRASMSLDLGCVEKGLRKLGPPGLRMDSLRLVDAYIKAFYLPWDELGKWAATHLPQYGKMRILGLIECVADSQRIRQPQKKALLAEVDAELAQYG